MPFVDVAQAKGKQDVFINFFMEKRLKIVTNK